jgi:hypothetical protein
MIVAKVKLMPDEYACSLEDCVVAVLKPKSLSSVAEVSAAHRISPEDLDGKWTVSSDLDSVGTPCAVRARLGLESFDKLFMVNSGGPMRIVLCAEDGLQEIELTE